MRIWYFKDLEIWEISVLGIWRFIVLEILEFGMSGTVIEVQKFEKLKI